MGARLGDLWGLDIVSLRLSGVFGPWERATGVRDTLSPHCQILAAAVAGEDAILPRAGLRDWIYAPDVADAVLAVGQASALGHGVYNVSTGRRFTLLDWGGRLALSFPGFVCRLAQEGEAATIDFHGPSDRAPLAVERDRWRSRLARDDGRDGLRRAAGRLVAGPWTRCGDRTMRLGGKVALVTGAGSGIGQAIALLFAREGARLALADRDEAGLSETSGLIAAAGGEALVESGDVGQPGFADAVAGACATRLGGLDVLVTAAGFSCGGTVTTTPPEDWDAVFRANVGGTFLFARAAIPLMQQRGGGAIVTFASQLALAGGRGNSAYIAAKGAILSLTRTMALDYAADGIRVNAIAPGAIDTPMLRRSFARHADPEPIREASRNRHAMKRFGRAEEVAQAALYLASDASSFSTGTTLVVDGGWLAN